MSNVILRNMSEDSVFDKLSYNLYYLIGTAAGPLLVTPLSLTL